MNLRHQFYRAYYENYDPRVFPDKERNDAVETSNSDHFKRVNETIFSRIPNLNISPLGEWHEDGSDVLVAKIPLQAIRLFTTYPGLIIGAGYTHETGSLGEMKLGFHFDYVSGLPVIPGHSVKGLLRSIFPKANLPGMDPDPALREGKIQFLLTALNLSKAEVGADAGGWIDLLEQSIFAGFGDTFFDAHIFKTGDGNRVVGPDNLTPHTAGPLQNPVPLPFLKVLPGVGFRFSFSLQDSVIGNVTVSVNQKVALFTTILENFGVGAKTNVGYGRMISAEAHAKRQFSAAELKAAKRAEQQGARLAKENALENVIATLNPESDYVTTQPASGAELKGVYGVILPLTEPEQKKQDKLPEQKRRKRITIVKSDGISINNKWHRKFHQYEAFTLLRLDITLDPRTGNHDIVSLGNVNIISTPKS